MSRSRPIPDYERLVREHHAEVYRSAWRILRHEEDARDVAQEVFLDVLGEPGRFASAEEPARVLRWLAARKALARLRGDRNRRGREEDRTMQQDALGKEQGTGERAAEEAEVRGIVARELAGLTDDLRCALALRFGEGMSFAGMARALGVSAPTARERVERGLERLRARLGQAGCAGFAPMLPGWLGNEAPVAPPAGLEAGLLALGGGAAAKSVATNVALGLAGVLLAGVALAAAVLPERGPAPAATAGQGELPAVAAVEPGAVQVPPAEGLRIALSEEEGTGSLAPSAPLERADEPATGRLIGRLTDAERRPVVGAALYASSVARDGKMPRYQVEGQSDEQGRFELHVPVERADGQRYRLSARHGSFVTYRSAELLVSLEEAFDLGEVELMLRSDALPGAWTADAFVVDEAGVPVAGAVVTAERPLLADVLPWQVEVESRGVTDAGGRVQLSGEWLGEKRARVVAEGQGFRAARFEFSVTRVGHDELRFVLERGFSVIGRVVAFEAGATPDGLQVYAVGRDKSRWIQARLLADGRFELSGLDESDEYELYADAPAYSKARRVGLEPDAGELRLELKRERDPRDVGDHMAEIHGRVVDAETGEPVEVDEWAVDEHWVADADRDRPAEWLLAHFRLGSMAQRAAQFMVREPDSEVHLSGLRPGTYIVRAAVHGYAPALVGPFELAEGELVSDVVLTLERGVTVAGVVRDARGAAVPDALVWLDADGPDAATRLADLDAELVREDPRWLMRCIKTDASGAFRFEHLPSRLPYRLGVLHRDRRPVLADRIELAPDGARQGLELRAGDAR